MTEQPRDPQELPEDPRPEANALELDRIKQPARPQAMRGEWRAALPTVLTVAALTLSLGVAFVIAGTGPPSSPSNSGSSKTSAASTQYKPGKGCGKPSDHPAPKPPKPCP